MKKYTIQTSRSGRGTTDRVSTYTGTVEELTAIFGYTLEIGNSHNHKIDRHPKTIKSLIKNLEKSYDIKEGATYSRTSISLIENPVATASQS